MTVVVHILLIKPVSSVAKNLQRLSVYSDQTSYRATVGTDEISDEELQEVVRLHDQPSRNQKAANMSATKK